MSLLYMQSEFMICLYIRNYLLCSSEVILANYSFTVCWNVAHSEKQTVINLQNWN